MWSARKAGAVPAVSGLRPYPRRWRWQAAAAQACRCRRILSPSDDPPSAGERLLLAIAVPIANPLEFPHRVIEHALSDLIGHRQLGLLAAYGPADVAPDPSRDAAPPIEDALEPSGTCPGSQP
jgi:hypothetical protein